MGAILHPWRNPLPAGMCVVSFWNIKLYCVCWCQCVIRVSNWEGVCNRWRCSIKVALLMQSNALVRSRNNWSPPMNVEDGGDLIWAATERLWFLTIVRMKAQWVATRLIASVAARNGRNPKCGPRHKSGARCCFKQSVIKPMISFPRGSMRDIGRNWSGLLQILPGLGMK